MMDAASAAAMSDPDRNPHFRRRWDQPPMPRVVPVHQPPDGTLGSVGVALLKAWRQARYDRDHPQVAGSVRNPAKEDTRITVAVLLRSS